MSFKMNFYKPSSQRFMYRFGFDIFTGHPEVIWGLSCVDLCKYLDNFLVPLKVVNFEPPWHHVLIFIDIVNKTTHDIDHSSAVYKKLIGLKLKVR